MGKGGGKSGGGWKASLASVLAQHNAAKVDGSKASFATMDKRSDVLFQGFQDLRSQGFKLDSVQQFAGRHMEALARSWESRGLSPSTIQNNISIFRTFASWIGKEGMVEKSEKYVSSRDVIARSTVATEDKSWSARGVSPEMKIAEVRYADPRVAVQLELQRAFGLRANESWQLRPHEADKGGYLAVNHGTKGGRDRVVPISTPLQRAVLERAKELAPRNRSTSDQSKSLAQWKNHYYSTVRNAGIRRDVGITSHGLRHERLNEVYREITGHASPIQGGRIADHDAHHAARQEVSEVAGHSREGISSAYIGS